jgi:hypothetical protein
MSKKYVFMVSFEVDTDLGQVDVDPCHDRSSALFAWPCLANFRPTCLKICLCMSPDFDGCRALKMKHWPRKTHNRPRNPFSRYVSRYVFTICFTMIVNRQTDRQTDRQTNRQFYYRHHLTSFEYGRHHDMFVH